jgi:hypothetical protein
MVTWSREQGATHRLLSNNFNEERWRTAALKNAYALMGKRRFGMAILSFPNASFMLIFIQSTPQRSFSWATIYKTLSPSFTTNSEIHNLLSLSQGSMKVMMDLFSEDS